LRKRSFKSLSKQARKVARRLGDRHFSQISLQCCSTVNTDSLAFSFIFTFSSVACTPYSGSIFHNELQFLPQFGLWYITAKKICDQLPMLVFCGHSQPCFPHEDSPCSLHHLFRIVMKDRVESRANLNHPGVRKHLMAFFLCMQAVRPSGASQMWHGIQRLMVE
jgi:hypothetical protein